MNITGTVNVTHYTAYTDDITADDALFNIYVDARLALFGDDSFTDDTVAMAGQLRNNGELALAALTLTDTTSLVSSSQVAETGNLSLGASADDAVVVRNLPGAVWTMTGSSEILQPGDDSYFVNLGVLTTGASAHEIDADFYNRGTLDVGESLTFGGAVTRLFGVVEGAGEVTTDIAVLIGTTVSCAEFYASTLRALGDVAITSTYADTDRLVLADATLTLSGNATLTAGSIVGDGEIDCAGSAVLAGEHVQRQLQTSPGSILSVNGAITVVNSGQLTLEGGPIALSIISSTAETVNLAGGAEILNAAGATWTDTANETLISSADDKVAFDNLGVFQEDWNGKLSAVQNDGVMQLGPGQPLIIRETSSPLVYPSLTFLSSIEGSGEIDVGPGTVTTDGAVAKRQTVVFAAAAGSVPATLDIADIADFAAAIKGFAAVAAADDTLVFSQSGWSFEAFAPSAGGGSLVFSDGAAQASVSLIGDYDPSKFHAAVSGSQTTITYG